MKKPIILFLFIFSVAFLFAEPAIPASLSHKFTRVCDSVISDDGEWHFLNTEKLTDSAQNKINTVYAMNVKTGEYFKIFENTGYDGICPLHYFSKTHKLYFIVNNGGYKKNGVQTFEGIGIYTLQKDSDGNYSDGGLKRYASLPNWIAKNLDNAYLINFDTPDYEGFLSYLYGFADAGSNPVFRIKKDDGLYIYGEDALRYVCSKNQFEKFINETRGNGLFPLEKYLFVCDKSGNPTDKTAYTNNGSKKFEVCEDRSVTKSYFVEADSRLYFFVSTGSSKNVGTKNESWSYDYSTVYEVFDDDDEFYFQQPIGLEHLRAEPYVNGRRLPIYEEKNRLVINDADGERKWIYTNAGVEKYDDVKDRIAAEDKIALGNENVELKHNAWLENPIVGILLVICVLLFVCALALAVILTKYLSGRFTTKQQRTFAFKIQESEKQKIAKDIHDTIVQDIRAIRIDAEMLLVDEKSKQKKSELVEKITECIVKMRNICYGLSPAELSLQGTLQTSDVLSDKVDLLSILDTLCNQFTTQTKIPCQLNVDVKMESAPLSKEICENIVRIVQEAFRNIEKHSYATEAQVLVRKESDKKNPENKNLGIFIIDDGRGCDLKEALSRKSLRQHFGLRSMQERMQMIGGEISFRSVKGDGMQVKLKIEN